MSQDEGLSQANEAYLESIFESSYDGIYITDREGLTLKVNRAFERITGVSRENLVGRYMEDLVQEGTFSCFITRDVVEQKKPVTLRQTVKDNCNLIITGSPIFNEAGEVEMVITNVRDITELVELEKKLKLTQMASTRYQEELFREVSAGHFVCESPALQSVVKLAGLVAPRDSSVLILGETGVGKEVLARYIHESSDRRGNNYIKLNCGSIPPNLLESELFGYAPGAFTGASPKGKVGMFELADEGTLFLDEIGELPLELQSSLLRVLQDGEVTRVGDTKSKKVNVRLITATNRVLEDMVAQGTFRRDLYYRLNVISLTVPPLRERPEDIPGLAELFLRRLNEKYHESKIMTARFLDRLVQMPWPGNVREMSNFIERQFTMGESDILDGFVAQGQGDAKALVTVEGVPPLKEAVRAVESTLVSRAMQMGGNTYRAAQLLGVSQPTFFRKYREYWGGGEKRDG